MTQPFNRITLAEMWTQHFSNTAHRPAWIGLAVIVILLNGWIFGIWTATVSAATAAATDSPAEAEAQKLVTAWPTDQPPFVDWTVPLSSHVAGEIRLAITHRTTGEQLQLVLRVRDDSQPAFARSQLYNIFYFSTAKSAHTSPEADRLLPQVSIWLKKVETNRTALLPYDEAQRRAQEQREKEEARQKVEAERQQRRDRIGIQRLVAPGIANRLSPQRLRPFTGLLVLVLFLFCLPRVHRAFKVVRGLEFTYITRIGDPAGPILALLFAIRYGISWTGATPSIGLSDPVGAWLTSTSLLAAPHTFWVAAIIAGILTVLGAYMIGMTAYVVFDDDRMAGLSALLYLAWRLVQPIESDQISALVADAALSAGWLALQLQILSHKNTPRMLLAAPLFALAAWAEPAYWSTSILGFAALLIDPRFRSSTVSFPIAWLFPIITLLMIVPAVLRAILPLGLTAPDMLFGGWTSPIWPILHNHPETILFAALAIFFGGTAIYKAIHAERATAVLFVLFYGICLIGATGLEGWRTDHLLAGRSIVFPCWLIAAGLISIIHREPQSATT